MNSKQNKVTNPDTNERGKRALDPFERWGYINRKVLTYELTETEQVKFKEGLANLHSQRRKIETYASDVLDDMLVFHGNKNAPPILWCFNNWSAPLLLARHLPDSVTLIAAISTHLLAERQEWRLKARLHEHLVKRYLTTLKAHNLISNQLLIGGNCQGAPVAESLAVRINNQTGLLPQLVTLDYTQRKAYCGPKLMLFGKDSSYNPFNSEKDPNKMWETLPGKWQCEFLNAAHGKYFREPGITELSQLLVREIQQLITTNVSVPDPTTDAYAQKTI